MTHDPLPAVFADPTQLQQIFANLVGNAIKYRRQNCSPRVHVSARRDGSIAEFSVADNGIGIEAEYFDQIFQIYKRLHTHEEYEGTGIGLALVKRSVEQYGGTVRVESIPGEGSTFFFTLPAA
ncbi:MAG: ATP-binding protein [Methanospirillum sp.]